MSRADNFSKFVELRKEYPFLSYDAFSWKITDNNLIISYSYNLSDKYFFNPVIRIPYKTGLFIAVDKLSPSAIDNLVFYTGMIEMVSYWKAACPKEVRIKPFRLTDGQVGFWKKIYYQGLGEFFYLNSISAEMDDFMEIVCTGDRETSKLEPLSTQGCLVPVGGGKDSAVTMGLLNASGTDWLPFSINPGRATKNVIRDANKSMAETVEFQREIHPELLKLNAMGFLNGHTPFSALLGFYLLLAAYLTGKKDIILSNESSANETTVPGTKINHQYSKSFEFENDFRYYVSNYISDDLNYFSLLRPISEFQIASLFSKMTGFHKDFRSCNAGSKTGTWCGHCPKCLFTFIILSPFLSPESLVDIFGKNLLDDPSLEDILDQLSGYQDIKPFDCIGTVEEVNLALSLASGKYSEENLPWLLKQYQKKPGVRYYADYHITTMLKNIASAHNVPENYIHLLARAL
jgi:UDP-N-acetyl-alpha-D-muramoyl-L-alanyl-L-glutamate epimerase